MGEYRASNFLRRNMSPCGDKNFQCLTNSSKSVLLKKEERNSDRRKRVKMK